MLQIELGLWVTIICIYFMIWICVKKPEFTTKVKGVTSRKWFLMIMFTFGSLIGYWLYALYTVVTAELDKLKIVGSLLNTFVVILSWYIARSLYNVFLVSDCEHLNEKEKNVCNLLSVIGILFILFISFDGSHDNMDYTIACTVISVFISTFWGVSFVYKEENFKESFHNFIDEFSGVAKRYWIINILLAFLLALALKAGSVVDILLTKYNIFIMGSALGVWVLLIATLFCGIIEIVRKFVRKIFLK